MSIKFIPNQKVVRRLKFIDCFRNIGLFYISINEMKIQNAKSIFIRILVGIKLYLGIRDELFSTSMFCA